MPVVDGIKVACHACIRGHRSTKCDHQQSRHMYAVRRPGRPLTQCPHKDPRSCECDGLSEVIVKVKKDEGQDGVSGCACVQTSEVNHGPLHTVSPKSPVKGNNTQATGTAAAAKRGTAQLVERQEESVHPVKSDGSKLDDRRLAPERQSLRSSNHQPVANIVGPAGHSKTPNESPQRAGHTNADSLLLSRKRKHITPEPDLVLHKLPESLARSKFSSGKSCCAASPATLQSLSSTSSVTQPPSDCKSQQPAWDGPDSLQPVTKPSAGSDVPPSKLPELAGGYIGQLDPRNMPQTTLYPLPPNYATAQNPMNVGQNFLHQQTTLSNAQTVPTYAPSGLIGSAALPSTGNSMYASMHNCNCGSGCQCLFCAVHPYNSATLQQVHSIAHHLPYEEYQPKKTPQIPPQNRKSATSEYSQPVQPYMPYDHTILRNGSSLPQTTTSLASVPQYFSQPLSDPQYFTLTYQINPADLNSCTDTSGSCKCGDDCACVGCLTHTGHTGAPLDLNPLQDPRG